MTVGDFVSVRPSDRGTRVERLVATLGEDVAAETLIRRGLFARSLIVPTIRRGWLDFVTVAALVVLFGAGVTVIADLSGIRLPWSAIAGVGAALLIALAAIHRGPGLRDSKHSLIDIMEGNHDVGKQPTAAGYEMIGIPFPHVIMLMGRERSEFRSILQAQATSALNRRWRNYVDPLIGVRVRAMVSPRVADDELVAFFGSGIFAPRPGEQPTGRVEISLPGQAEPIQPSLPDGSPAGLYRGQTALAFSTSIRLTPATVDPLTGVSGRFWLGPTMGDGKPGAYTLDWDADPGEPTMKPARDAIDPPPGFDAAFRVRFPDATFDLRLVEDARPSRLLRAAPQSRALAIVGIIEPRNDGRPPVRWWIDLDGNGHLVCSAMRPAKRSLICTRGRMSVWDWTTPGTTVRHAARLETVSTIDGSLTVLAAQPGRPFGWLSLPARSQTVTYDPTQIEGFELDWLDFSGAVENVLGRAERLGAWLHRNGYGAVIPGIDRTPGDETLLVMAPGAGDYQPGWRGEWLSGMRMISDALVLEVIEGGQL